MLDESQQSSLASWVNKNSKRLNDSVARARSQADFRAVLAEATAYFDQLRSERDTHAEALADILQRLEQGPSSQQQAATWARTETELRQDAEIQKQVIGEFDRHIDACEALIAWVEGELAPVAMVGAAAPAVPSATRQPFLASKTRWALAVALGIVGILVAVGLLLPSLKEARSASGAQAVATAVKPVVTQPAQALLPSAKTPTREQGVPGSAADSLATPTSAAATAELAKAAEPSPRASETATARPTSTRTPSPASTATPTATRMLQPSPTPTATRTLQPSPTSLPSTTGTPGRTPTLQVVSPTVRVATSVPSRASSTPISPSAAILLEPHPNETLSGNVKFAWQPVGPLPSGAAYEVVWWNTDEDSTNARGIAATTTETSLTANLDYLYSSGQARSKDFYWTVIVVQTTPYARLTQPAQSGPQLLTYASSAGGAPSPPTNPLD